MRHRFQALGLLVILYAGVECFAGELHITHGPILGRLDTHHIGIWARTSRPGTFRVRYGSTWYDNAVARRLHRKRVYCIVTVNNVFPNPIRSDQPRWQAFPHPQVIFKYYDGLS